MPLTDTALRNLKPNGTPTKLTDSEGLYLYLSPSGGKLWRFDYRYGGKRKALSLGAYPAISLREARRKRDDAAAAREKALTFAVVAKEWFATRQDSYAATNIKKKR